MGKQTISACLRDTLLLCWSLQVSMKLMKKMSSEVPLEKRHPGWGGVGGAHQKLVEATHIDQIATVKLGTVQTRLSSPAPFALNISRTMPTAAQQMKSAGPKAAASSAVLYATSNIPAPTEPHSSPFLSC